MSRLLLGVINIQWPKACFLLILPINFELNFDSIEVVVSVLNLKKKIVINAQFHREKEHLSCKPSVSFTTVIKQISLFVLA